MDWYQVFGFGLVGGLIPELLGLYRIRTHSAARRPAYLKTYFYWFVSAGMVVAGGLLAAVYNHYYPINGILAIHLGASAPLILGSMRNAPDLQGSGAAA